MYNNKNSDFTLITGASNGIGKSIAFEFAKRGYNLILVSRNSDLLSNLSTSIANLYKVKVHFIAVDLSEEASAKYIYSWCLKNNITISALINNAGAALFGKFHKLDIENQISMINLNICSLVKLTYYFIPSLKNRTDSYILNVSSIASLYPLPYYSTYAASKAFVLSFTESLHFEMRKSNITISCLCPGDTDTNFFINAGNRHRKKSLTSPDIVAKIAIGSLLNKKKLIFPSNAWYISKIPKKLLRLIINHRVSLYKFR